MNAYVDSSVLIRILFGQADQLSMWSEITRAVSSDLVRVECLRTIDRAAIRGRMAAEEVSRLRSAALDLLGRLTLAPMTPSILARAADPFPTALGTLDAIHLATALEVGRDLPSMLMTTHDAELALAARSVGIDVAGA